MERVDQLFSYKGSFIHHHTPFVVQLCFVPVDRILESVCVCVREREGAYVTYVCTLSGRYIQQETSLLDRDHFFPDLLTGYNNYY